MLKKLLIVAVSGTVLCIVALGLGWVIGGKEMHNAVIEGDGYSINLSDDDDASGPRKSREFAVDGGQTIAMAVPVDLKFVRGDEAKMVVTGPAKAVDNLVWKDGRLSLKGGVNHIGRGLRVTITAPQIAGLDLDAPGDIKLTDLQQDQLRLNASGAVDLNAEGKVRQLFVKTEGASDLNFRKLDLQDATLRIDGVGDIEVAASNLVDVIINGAGEVTLYRKPAQLRSEINGIGSIERKY